jgi:hypothetical protein
MYRDRQIVFYNEGVGVEGDLIDTIGEEIFSYSTKERWCSMDRHPEGLNAFEPKLYDRCR